MAAVTRSCSAPSDFSYASAAPANPPVRSLGIWISCVACANAAVASLSDFPGARLKEMVVATNWLWWLTASGVLLALVSENARSGVMVSAEVDTDAALEALEFPVDAIVDCAAMRTALFEAALALDAAALGLTPVSARDTTLFDRAATLLVSAKVGFAAEAAAVES